MTKDITPPPSSLRAQFRLAARDVCRPLGMYDELKKLTPPHVTSAPSVLACKPPSPISQIVKRSDHLSDKKAKSYAQVESFVGQHAVEQSSCGLKPEETRRWRVTARFSSEERQELVGRAQNARLTLSEYMRVVALKSPALDPQRHKLLLKTNYELTRQGVNLNQIAKHLNAGHLSPQQSEGMLAELFDAFIDTQKQVHQALAEGRTYE